MSAPGTPVRIQRMRTKGWRMPENTVYVGRPTRWGNPYVVGTVFFVRDDHGQSEGNVVASRAHAVALFRQRSAFPARVGPEIKKLRGKNLACWCPLDQPCHADVLLEWANE